MKDSRVKICEELACNLTEYSWRVLEDDSLKLSDEILNSLESLIRIYIKSNLSEHYFSFRLNEDACVHYFLKEIEATFYTDTPFNDINYTIRNDYVYLVAKFIDDRVNVVDVNIDSLRFDWLTHCRSNKIEELLK